jgi:sec-independent protein translocase protein TatA
MGSMSIWHWLVVALVILLLFGKGRISDMMGDLAKGIKSFKKGLAEDETPPAPRQVTGGSTVEATTAPREEANRP